MKVSEEALEVPKLGRSWSVRETFSELAQKQWTESIVGWVLIVGFGSVFIVKASGFTSSYSLQYLERYTAEIGFVSLGMALALISGGIDLSVGAIYGLTNIMALLLAMHFGLSIWLTIGITVLLGAVIGAINGLLIAYLRAIPFLVTVVMLVIISAIETLISGHFGPEMTGFITAPLWQWLGKGFVGPLPSGLFIFLVVVVLGNVLLTRGKFGWHIRSIGGNRREAQRAGVRVKLVIFAVYVLSGAFSAVGGILYAAQVASTDPATGQNTEIIALAAVVIGGISLSGGRGTFLRALLGAATVSVIEVGLASMGVADALITGILAGTLLVAVTIDLKLFKNRSKAVQKNYVNPAAVELGRFVDTSSEGGGVFAQNRALEKAEAIGLGLVEGPGDVILDRSGGLYCGDRRGWIHRFSGKELGDHEVFARIGGTPLGLAFDQEDNLIVCVAGMGLFSVSPDRVVSKLVDRLPRTWTQLHDDSRLRMTTDLDVTPDGKIYFSEATTRFEFSEGWTDGVEGRGNGRLLCYDPQTGVTRVVLKGFVFPNGICSCHDGESLLIASSWRCEIYRYWHSGAREGQLEIFLGNLPGYPDNINRASDGSYWIALNGMRSPCYDLAMRMPKFRRRMIKQLPFDEWLFPSLNHGAVLKVSAQGDVLQSLWDPGAKSHATITSMREFDGELYIGGLDSNRIGRVLLVEPIEGKAICRCGQRPCLTEETVPAESVSEIPGGSHV